MKTIYSETQLLHDVRLEFTSGAARAPYESPARCGAVVEALRRSGLGPVLEPRSFGLDALTAVHSRKYVEFLQAAWPLWVAERGEQCDAIPYCFPHRGLWHVEPRNIEGRLGYYSFDLSSAIGAGTWPAVRAAAECALTGAELVLQGEPAAFALCRPPGHHAGRDVMGGYCYINNAAVAAQFLRSGGLDRVAILDVDYHHGNGTQSIFYTRPDVLYVSIHADPAEEYPHFSGYASETGSGPGAGYNCNYPLPMHSTGWAGYAAVLEQAAARIRSFAPAALIVSLGLDTHAADPIAAFSLGTADFLELGTALARLGLPVLFILEGGYALDEMGASAVNVLQAFEQAER